MVAETARERAFSRVRPEMILEERRTSELPAALCTDERLFVRVHCLDVILQSGALHKLPTAVLALKRLFTGVYSYVGFEIILPYEAHAAVIAHKRLVPGVRPHVCFQQTGESERSVAD